MTSLNDSDPYIGAVLQERYRIIRKLGDGGMGAVYEGEHLLIKRRVAIKVLHAQFAQNPEVVARFQREAQAATSIRHANIVEVTDMGRFPDGTSYMVLEFLEGNDWSHDIETQGPQPLGKCVHILSQVCDALEAAHQTGIVHRDMKPENIFLIERRGDPHFAKVLDFGISKVQANANQDRSLTQTGTALGTPYYMAPEQCQGQKDIDHRADIYSLGVILYQSLTGQYPFDDESYPMLVLKICTEQPPPLARYREGLPPQIQEIVNCMLAKHREHRFNNCAEVRNALAPFLEVYDKPVVTNAPSTANIRSSVLEAHSEPGGGSVMTPTGTAYLDSTPSMPGASYDSMPGAQTSSSSRGLWIGIVVALIALIGLGGLGLAGYWFLADRSRTVAVDTPPPPPPPVGTPPVEPTVPPNTNTPSLPSTPVEPTAPSTVHVEVQVQPPEAAQTALIIVNGRANGSTFARDLEPSDQNQHIEVRAEGYRPFHTDVMFDTSRTIVATLSPLESPRGPNPSPRRSSKRTPRPDVVRPVPRPPAPSPRPVAQPATPATPRPTPSTPSRRPVNAEAIFGR